MMEGCPNFDSRMKLYSETGYFLAIRSDGQVEGTQETDDSDICLEVLNAGDVGHVRIRSEENGLYLRFAPDGSLCAEVTPDASGAVFKEHFEGSYNGYQCVDHPDWYVGISKKGEAKNGDRTFYGQKAVKFLPVRD